MESTPGPRSDPPRRRVAALHRQSAWSVAAVLLIGMNLRPAITSVGPLIGEIRRDLDLTGLAVGVLTMAPVVCLGLFGPLAPPLVRRFGVEAVLFGALLGIVAGCALRGAGIVPLYVGTVGIGAAMSLLGVLAPVLVKRDFPHRVGPMMGLYTMAIGFGAALSTATAVPLATAFGGSWRWALMVWGASALVAAVVLVPQLAGTVPARIGRPPHRPGLLRSPLAWQVTAFLAFVSSLAYSTFSWAPSMLEARGLDSTAAGAVVALSYLAQMPSGFLAPVLGGRLRDQRAIAVGTVLLIVAGLTGYVVAPAWSLPACSIVLGLGQGGAFGIALTFIVLRAGDPQVAARLSGLAQGVGYTLCGVLGPFAVGLIHDAAGWGAVAVWHAALGLAAILSGLGAGAARTIRLERVEGADAA
jgi:CP family cyanate transporter-like MFS transporter